MCVILYRSQIYKSNQSEVWKLYQLKHIILIGGACELDHLKCKNFHAITFLYVFCSQKMSYVTFQIYLKALSVMKMDINTLWLLYQAIQFTVTTVNSQGLPTSTTNYDHK